MILPNITKYYLILLYPVGTIRLVPWLVQYMQLWGFSLGSVQVVVRECCPKDPHLPCHPTPGWTSKWIQVNGIGLSKSHKMDHDCSSQTRSGHFRCVGKPVSWNATRSLHRHLARLARTFFSELAWSAWHKITLQRSKTFLPELWKS